MTKLRALACLSLLLVLAACSDDDKPQQPPEAPSASASASAGDSDAPPWPTLTKSEKAAVQDAFADYDRSGAVLGKLQNDPAAAVKNRAKLHATLRRYAYNPILGQAEKQLAQLAEQHVRFTGKRHRLWRVPTKVDLSSKIKTIEFQVCESLGTFKVTRDGKNIPQPSKPRLATLRMNPAYEGSRITDWRISNVRTDGTC